MSGPDQVFAALADPTRRQVLRTLVEEGRSTATELAADLPVTRQAVSKHLSRLEEAGLVTAERAGRETRYAPTPDRLAEATAWIEDVTGRWDRRLERLRRRVDRPTGA